MSDYKDEFIAESMELLSKLENNLLVLESTPDNQQELEEFLRGLHTLKGSSGMYGFEKIGQLMHSLESIFDSARKSEEGINAAILNLGLESIDFAMQVFQSKEDVGTTDENEYNLLLKRMGKRLEKLSASESGEKEKAQNFAGHTAQKTYYIKFTVEKDFESRGIKIESVFKELEESGTLISIPEKNEDGEIVEWELFFVSTLIAQEVEDIFIFLLDVTSIEKLANENMFLHDEFKLFVQNNSSLKKKNNLKKLKQLIENIRESKGTAPVNKSKTTQHSNKDFLRVAADKLDEQMDLLSELVTAKAELKMIVDAERYAKLYKLVESLEKITNNFRKNILKTRMVQVKNWYVPMLRLIRDVSKQLGKDVDFVAEGLETEIDKNIIDSLEGPLTHIIRNSLDHGIETPEERSAKGKPAKAQIKLKAYHSGSDIYIEIHDDGRGIDTEKVRQTALKKGLIDEDTTLDEKQLGELLFLSGFSTASKITEVSGRGVGMDAVKKAIDQLRGDVQIRTKKEEGTEVVIKLPMLLSIVDTLLVRTGEQFFAIPLPDVQKCTQTNLHDLDKSDNAHLRIDGQLIPYIDLRSIFQIKSPAPEKQRIIVVQSGKAIAGFITDEVIGEYQAVLKPFDGFIINKEYFIGASLLADGRLSVILDTSKLIYDNIKSKK